MGYYYENNGNITHFEPDNTEDTLHIRYYMIETISDLTAKAAEYFGISENEVAELCKIYIENIHTRHITYDLHDSGDYEMFYIISYTKPADLVVEE